jgi:RNA polymerase sigma factor (sigma-70 family)
MVQSSLEALVEQAKQGHKAALEELISRIQNQVYNLALRMLWLPADAEDATQEILLIVITHLSQFRGEASFTTWVYRVASNHLLRTRKSKVELKEHTFEEFGRVIDTGLATLETEKTNPIAKVEERLLTEEIMLRCTLGMLICMDREHRLAYILGEIFRVNGEEGGLIMEVAPATFRKRLSRARQRLREFMDSKCGLINPANPCRCEKLILHNVKYRKLSTSRLLFAGQSLAETTQEEKAYLREQWAELEKLERIANLFRSHPTYATPERLTTAIKELFETTQFSLLEE